MHCYSLSGCLSECLSECNLEKTLFEKIPPATKIGCSDWNFSNTNFQTQTIECLKDVKHLKISSKRLLNASRLSNRAVWTSCIASVFIDAIKTVCWCHEEARRSQKELEGARRSQKEPEDRAGRTSKERQENSRRTPADAQTIASRHMNSSPANNVAN